MKVRMAVIISTVFGAITGIAITSKLKNQESKYKDGKIDKFKGYYNVLNEWLALKQRGNTLEEFFLDKRYATVAIYGMGEMGNRIYDDLKESKIEVKYAIDKNADNTYSDLKVYMPEENFPPVDVIVVTAIFDFDEIEQKLSQKVDCPVISLEDVLYDS